MAELESRSSLTLDPLAEAVSAARGYVRERLAEHGRLDLEDSAVLGVSELVTNATIHARTRIKAQRHAHGGRRASHRRP